MRANRNSGTSKGSTHARVRSSHRRRAALLIWTATPTVALLTGGAWANTDVWNGGSTTTSNFNDTANWNGVLPAANDLLVFNGSTRLLPVNNLTAATQFNGITFNSGSGAFNISGNSITLNGSIVDNSTTAQNFDLAMALNASENVTVVSGGLMSLNGVISGTSALVCNGVGTTNLSTGNLYSGGTNISNGAVEIQNSTAFGTGLVTVQSGGEAILSASGLTAANSFNISGNGLSTNSIPCALDIRGTVGNASGGIITIVGSGARIGAAGFGASISQQITSSGGAGNVEFYSKASGTSVFTIKNGADNWAGSTTVSNAYSGSSTPAVNLSMGASGVYPATSQLILNASSGTSVNFDVAGRGVTVAGLSSEGAGTNQVINSSASAGTLTFNTSGSATFSGAITNVGGTINVAMSGGAGTQTLSGTNTYVGTTTLNAGTLSVTGSLSASSAVTVNAATLAGTGSVGGVLLNNSNGTINPGATGPGTTGTLTLASLNVSAGKLGYDLNAPGTSDFENVIGNVNFNTGSAISVTGQTPGTYTLLTVNASTGSITGALPALAGTGATGGRPPTFQYDPTSWNPSTNANASSIVIDVSGAASLIWAGGVSGFTSGSADGMTWDNLAGTGAGGGNDQNWNNNGTQDYFYNGDSVTFNDTGTPNYNVSLTTSVTPGTVTFNNSAGNYTITGAGSIGGLASVTLNGTSSVTIGTTNNYSGGTTINNGTLNANGLSSLGTGSITLNSPAQLNINNANIGSGSLIINGGTIDNATGSTLTMTSNNPQTWAGSFTFAGSSSLNMGTGAVTLTTTPTITVANNTLTISGNITGSNGLTKAGAGTLILAGGNNYTGITNISAGTVVVANSTSLGSLSGAGVIIDGGTLDVGGDTTANNFEPLGLPFTIQGTGAGGIGAITNSSPTNGQFNTFRGNNVTLSGDALISGNRIDIGRAAASTLNLNGFTLTLNMNGSSPMFGIESFGTVTAGNIVVQQGTLDIEQNASVLDTSGTSTITFDSGSNVQFYQTSTPTVSTGVTRPMIFLGNNVIGSANGGLATVGSNLTLEGNVTLEAVNTGIPSLVNGYPLLITGNLNQSGGSYAVTKAGISTVTLSGSDNWTGGTFIQGGTLQLGSAGALPAGTAITFGAANGGTGTLDLNGNSPTVSSLAIASGAGTGNVIGNSNISPSTLTYAGGTSSYSGVIQNDLGTGTSTVALNVSSGNLTLSGSNTYTGGTIVTGGTLNLSSAHAFPAGTNLNIGSGALVVATTLATRTAEQVGTLIDSGAMDLQNNGLVIHTGSIATVTALAAGGYNNGAWNGPAGIFSSTAANDPTHLTTLGVMINDTGANTNTSTGTAVYTTFDGVPTVDADILVKYTYYGDANLSGAVDGSDYSLIDNGYLNNLTGWYNGDFNYDGVINGSDYTLIDNAYNTQGAQLSAQLATPTAEIAGSGVFSSAVPEPATLGLIGMTAAGLLGRRRRRN